MAPPTDLASFIAVIEKVIEQYRLFVEGRRGWYLLWDGAQEKPELAAQLLFYGIARNYCTANGIVIDREVDFGRGPVDFKFSNGYERRAHLEVKTTASSGTGSTDNCRPTWRVTRWNSVGSSPCGTGAGTNGTSERRSFPSEYDLRVPNTEGTCGPPGSTRGRGPLLPGSNRRRAASL
jgi:hypothetical protein